MGENTICKELYDWFEYATDIASTSAFVQQRDKVLPQASEDAKGYNLIHLDAIYDLLSNTYVDASLQSKRTTNEHRALVTL